MTTEIMAALLKSAMFCTAGFQSHAKYGVASGDDTHLPGQSCTMSRNGKKTTYISYDYNFIKLSCVFHLRLREIKLGDFSGKCLPCIHGYPSYYVR